jgi:hypothetical protein
MLHVSVSVCLYASLVLVGILVLGNRYTFHSLTPSHSIAWQP